MLKHLIFISGIFLFLSPSFAIPPDLDSWSFEGSFKKKFRHFERELTRNFKCQNKSDPSFIETLELIGYVDDSIKLIVTLKKSNLIGNNPNKENLNNFRTSLEKTKGFLDFLFIFQHDDDDDNYFSLPQKGPLFLNFLYSVKQIPDFVVDRLLKETGWTDFRPNFRPKL